MTAIPNLVNLCNFIKQNNKNLALYPDGIGLKIVLKYVQSDPNNEVLMGKMGI